MMPPVQVYWGTIVVERLLKSGHIIESAPVCANFHPNSLCSMSERSIQTEVLRSILPRRTQGPTFLATRLLSCRRGCFHAMRIELPCKAGLPVHFTNNLSTGKSKPHPQYHQSSGTRHRSCRPSSSCSTPHRRSSTSRRRCSHVPA
jgi:hypothetical protein